MPAPSPLLDDETLRELIPRLRRFARSLAADPAAADDLVQATLERALTRGASRRNEDALQPWLFSVLYRQFIDDHRRAVRWKRIASLFATENEPRPPTPDQVFDARTSLASFSQLPAEQRALLMLVSVEGLGYREAADVLGIPIGTVMSRLSRARQALRAMDEEKMPASPVLRVLR
ncbi:sigma-70 family RNA polymerase sigma factor [Luteimonas viscosa]|uniref:Sigma-70 family RNA polymerase sigma factor n=1 Tax=Luteimonas viscosa TaxID=1132694 RepID=A0A5D4XU71_9GAMM|nr:sigma-70 family RNA polymerase sigma factor [Luteimonas viscosa]TYT27614.1 sigma-70 family RNA polymerase sigma factor [Luteimonas viscosa]